MLYVSYNSTLIEVFELTLNTNLQLRLGFDGTLLENNKTTILDK